VAQKRAAMDGEGEMATARRRWRPRSGDVTAGRIKSGRLRWRWRSSIAQSHKLGRHFELQLCSIVSFTLWNLKEPLIVWLQALDTPRSPSDANPRWHGWNGGKKRDPRP
jgi:hypothetical protein